MCNTCRVSSSALHGRIRHQFLQKFREVVKQNMIGPSGVVLLKGGKLQNVYSTDGEQLFRQVSVFPLPCSSLGNVIA